MSTPLAVLHSSFTTSSVTGTTLTVTTPLTTAGNLILGFAATNSTGQTVTTTATDLASLGTNNSAGSKMTAFGGTVVSALTSYVFNFAATTFAVVAVIEISGTASTYPITKFAASASSGASASSPIIYSIQLGELFIGALNTSSSTSSAPAANYTELISQYNANMGMTVQAGTTLSLSLGHKFQIVQALSASLPWASASMEIQPPQPYVASLPSMQRAPILAQ